MPDAYHMTYDPGDNDRLTIVDGRWVPACYVLNPLRFDYTEWFASWGFIRCGRLKRDGKSCNGWVKIVEHTKRKEWNYYGGDLTGFTGRAWCDTHFKQHAWNVYSCNESACRRGGFHYHPLLALPA